MGRLLRGNLAGQDEKAHIQHKSFIKFIPILVVGLLFFGFLIEKYSKWVILISLIVTFMQRSKLTSQFYLVAFLIRLFAYSVQKLFPPQNMAVKLLLSSFHVSFVTFGLCISFLQVLEMCMRREDILSIIVYNIKLCIMPKKRDFELRENYRWPLLGAVRQYWMSVLFVLTAILINLIIGFLRQEIIEITTENIISSYDIMQFIISILLTVAIFRSIITEFTALDAAIYEDDEDAIVALIAAGSEEKKKNESTPLYLAIRANKLNAVRASINVGADVNQKCKDGTPLNAAIQENNLEVINMLYDAGVDVNLETHGGFPLQYAIREHKSEAAKALIELGADVSALSWGQSALHTAIREQMNEVMKDLINAGADINVKTQGRSLIEYATLYCNTDARQFQPK